MHYVSLNLLFQLTSGIDKLSGSELRNKGQTPTSGELTRRESLLSVLKSQQRQLNSLLSQAHISAAGKRDDENRKWVGGTIELLSGSSLISLWDALWLVFFQAMVVKISFVVLSYSKLAKFLSNTSPIIGLKSRSVLLVFSPSFEIF